LNARFRKVIDARGHFPNEQAAMKVLYLAVRFPRPEGHRTQRWITRWKPILNVLAVSFHDRMPETAGL
jgi:putative transposase